MNNRFLFKSNKMQLKELTSDTLKNYNTEKILILWNIGTYSLGQISNEAWVDNNLNQHQFKWHLIKAVYFLP